MLFVRMLAGAILVHELLYIFRDGSRYLTQCFLPTFGLHLGPRAHSLVHGALMVCCAAMMVAPELAWLHPLALLLLSLTIASYSLRLSNHFILAWFMLLLLCLGPHVASGAEGTRAFVLWGVRGLLVLTYGLAFFHKLNADYFSRRHSIALQLADFWCWDRKVVHPWLTRPLRAWSVYGTVVTEALLALLLLWPATRPVGFVLGLLFHFSLALLGIVNFSAMMYAGLIAFVPPETLGALEARLATLGLPTLGAACALAMLVVWAVTPRWANRHCPYVHRAPAWGVQLAFGCLTALLLLGGVLWTQLPVHEARGWASFTSTERWLLGLCWGAFLLNGLGPYLGFKTEFSFAMFSNLRCEPWRHLLVPAGWRLLHRPEYLELESIEGLPRADQVRGDIGALMALRVLSAPGVYRYSRYFLEESLRRLCQVASPPPRIRLRYVTRGLRHDVEWFEPSRALEGRRSLHINFFPFLLPISPDAPHSEQGTVLDEKGRQFF